MEHGRIGGALVGPASYHLCAFCLPGFLAAHSSLILAWVATTLHGGCEEDSDSGLGLGKGAEGWRLGPQYLLGEPGRSCAPWAGSSMTLSGCLHIKSLIHA